MIKLELFNQNAGGTMSRPKIDVSLNTTPRSPLQGLKLASNTAPGVGPICLGYLNNN